MMHLNRYHIPLSAFLFGRLMLVKHFSSLTYWHTHLLILIALLYICLSPKVSIFNRYDQNGMCNPNKASLMA